LTLFWHTFILVVCEVHDHHNSEKES
jgi:hypothetical protein